MSNQENESYFFEKLLSNSESIDLKKLLLVFFSRWYWIVAAVFISGIIGFFILKITKPLYVASITFKYLEKQSELDELGSTKPTYIFSNSNTDYLTEKFNIRSQEVVENALKKLNQNFSFFRVKDFRKIDVYPFNALTLNVINYSAEEYEHGKFLLDENLTLHYNIGEKESNWKAFNNQIISVPGLQFQIDSVNTGLGYEYEFVFNDFENQAASIIGSIGMDEVEEAMPVMNLSFRHQNPKFTKDFIAKLIESYSEFDLQKKQKSSDLTIHFIRKQLNIYSDSLKVAARELEVFKQNHHVLDINTSASEIVGTLQALDEENQKLEIQKSYADILEASISKNDEPVNYLDIGIDATADNNLIGHLEKYNEVIQTRKELLLKYSPSSTAIKLIDEQLLQLRSQIKGNLAYQRKKSAGLSEILKKRRAEFRTKFNQIPELEKNFLYLQSNFEVNKNIYSLLLNKDIESSIVRAGILPTFTTISRLDINQISPKPLQVLFLSLFFGLSIGIGSILLTRFGNSKFTEIHKVDEHPSTALLGVIHHFPEKLNNSLADLQAFMMDRSIFTESISAIRTKLSFSSSNLEIPKHTEGKLIVISSQLSGEGKSFVTTNLALSFTKIEKRVLIIGADLRKSKLHRYFENKNKTGLCDYLQEKVLDINQIIEKTSTPYLDVIVAGTPPFNPGELLQKEQFETLLTFCKANYDYILIDTAPIGLVSDNIPVLGKADHVLFIIRWLKSEAQSYNLAWKITQEYGIKEVKIIVNDYFNDPLYSKITTGINSTETYSYYQSYGKNSYYAQQPKKWYQRIFRNKA